ncbi:MAG: hypothetical protein K1X57_18565 [Gemmataceae bacterium]|nr:hypothetical protein [Gemmataceae bacterium]
MPNRLPYHLARLFVAGVLLLYGLLKVTGGQFIPGEFTFDSRTDSLVTLVWHFYGYSPVYHRFLGVAECVPGLLLLWPRTATLGALMALPVALNIAVMDWCFGFPLPATLLATSLAALSAALLVADRKRLPVG